MKGNKSELNDDDGDDDEKKQKNFNHNDWKKLLSISIKQLTIYRTLNVFLLL